MHAFRFTVVLTTLLAAATIARGQAPIGQGLDRKDFAEVKSLEEAIEVVRERFKQDERPAFAFLISEDQVRKAIRVALESYEEIVNKRAKRPAGDREYFEKVVKPACLRIADHGEWSPQFSFSSFYTLHDGNVEYEGLGLRLRIDTPDAEFKAFALPIVDIFYGRFGG
jgi:hypothetical protein